MAKGQFTTDDAQMKGSLWFLELFLFICLFIITLVNKYLVIIAL